MADKGYESFGLAGKVALVSGGNRNIGRATVLTLAKAGAVPLILYGSDDEAARKVVAEVEKAGGRSGAAPHKQLHLQSTSLRPCSAVLP